jgi:hypothetical protein
MGPGYFIIAILGCADGSSACTPAATVPTHYSSQSACSAGINDALLAYSDLDFPTLVGECRAAVAPAAASNERVQAIPANAART